MNVGMTVRLKSGGPLMTVSSVEAHDLVICTWFDGNDKLVSSAFNPATLELEE